MKTYQIGNHTIIWGDIIEELEKIEENTIDLIFADPPYNIGKFKSLNKDEYLHWCYQWLNLSVQKLKDSGSLYLMASTQSMPYLDIFTGKKLTILSRIVWHYDSSGVQAKNFFGSLWEPIIFAVKNPKNYTFNAKNIMIEAKTGAIRKLIDYRKPVPAQYSNKKVPGNVWYYPRVRFKMPEYEKHPSQKPEKLLERIILASSNEHDLILDLFSGTFTTAAVAKKFNRKSINIDINEMFVKIGLNRLGKNENSNI